jgi:hypothetical protein
MLHTNIVEEGTLELLRNISLHSGFSNFYLAGGSALSLQIGHRKSIDLDYFSKEGFHENSIADILQKDYNATIINQYQNTILCSIDEVKVDVIPRHMSNYLNTV